MPFQKGTSGNPAGRTKGSRNRTNKEMRDFVNDVITRNLTNTKINKDLKELSPKQRLDFLLKLLEFILPKPKSVEIKEQQSNLMKLIMDEFGDPSTTPHNEDNCSNK